MSWEVKKLTDIITFQRGFDLPKKNFKNGNYPVVGSTEIIGYHNEFKVSPPGVVTGRSGTLGKHQFLNKEYWPHNTSLWVKDFKENDEKFIYYLLHTLDFKSLNGGSSVPTLNRNFLSSINSTIPPLKTQKKIASILSTYDDSIENNLKRIKLLEEAAQRIYKEWFVDFKFPNHENIPINKETGLPEGWEIEKIENIIKIIKGKKPKEELTSPQKGSVLYLLIDVLERKNLRYVNKEKLRLTEEGETLMIMDGSRSGVVLKSIGGAIGSTLSVFRILNDKISNEYCYQFFKRNQNEIISKNTGAAIPHANKSYIHTMEIRIPNTEVLRNYNSIVKPINENIKNLHTQNQNLKEARDLLLPRLMNRTIEV